MLPLSAFGALLIGDTRIPWSSGEYRLLCLPEVAKSLEGLVLKNSGAITDGGWRMHRGTQAGSNSGC
jgi:hypothetical protein